MALSDLIPEPEGFILGQEAGHQDWGFFMVLHSLLERMQKHYIKSLLSSKVFYNLTLIRRFTTCIPEVAALKNQTKNKNQRVVTPYRLTTGYLSFAEMLQDYTESQSRHLDIREDDECQNNELN